MRLVRGTSSRRLCGAVALANHFHGCGILCTTRRQFTLPDSAVHSSVAPDTGAFSLLTSSSSSSAASASPPVFPPVSDAWEAALRRFYDTLGSLSRPRIDHADHPESTRSLHDAHDKAVAAMQCCLRAGRFQEAVDVHVAACRCGLASLQSGSCSASAPDAAAVLDVLALAAARQLPFCVRQSRTMLCLLDAEDDHVPPTQHALLDARDTSVVELFRIGLQQRLHVLRTTEQLHGPLGHQYLLSAMREVRDSSTLREAIEPLPLVQLSSLALWHPLAYATPSAAAARRQRHVDTLGTARFDAHRYTLAEQTQMRHLSDAVASIQPLCTSSASFLAALAPDWDALFLRRAAETLVLPEAAHNVFPAAYASTRRSSARPRSAATTEAAAATWLDGSLFPSSDGAAGPAHALQRLEDTLRRRLHLDMVVPDPDFVLRHFQQLLQLARHREVIISHGVLLEIVDLAGASEDPRRFHARRVLLNVLRLTTSSSTGTAEDGATAPASRGRAHGRHSASGGRRRWEQTCGLTILGLQDELALLEGCPERLVLARSDHHSAGALSAACLQLPGSPSRGRGAFGEAGMLSALLVAKQLQRLVAAGGRHADVPRRRPPPVSEPMLDADEIVQGILDNHANHVAVHAASPAARSPQPAPLFKQRSASYWSRTPVVVATASPATRSAAFSVGMEMYPPVVVK